MTPAAGSARGKRKKGTPPAVAPVVGEAGVPTMIDDLAPTARELLEAARRLLESEGYSSLTLKAIGREAGQNESLVGYHFGGKTGLLVALVDWLVYDIVRDLHARVRRLDEGQDQLDQAMDDACQLIGDVESYRAFYDLMPHLLATREGRLRMAELYTTYRELNARALSHDLAQAGSPRARAIAAMHVALTDGLALQVLMGPGGVDVRLAAELWGDCVRRLLPEGAEMTTIHTRPRHAPHSQGET
jgi:AcrR family transcriptional regulator